VALFECHFYSEVLGIQSSMTVIFPQKTKDKIWNKEKSGRDQVPVLYLLHGASDDDTIWLRRTSIERYLESLDLAVVMPRAELSFYTDMEHGLPYFTFINKELPKIVHEFFSASEKREDTFIAGISMGGYGALKSAFCYPEQYGAVASISGVVDISHFMKNNIINKRVWDAVFGSKPVTKTTNDLYYLMDNCRQKTLKPKIFQCCGTEDFLRKDNQKFYEACQAKGFDLTYYEYPGSHDWKFWDFSIQKVLAWLPIKQ
jgi:S-formylglutathione hydrolase FrmB